MSVSVELINNEHFSIFTNAAQNAHKSIYIISPFIGLRTAKLLADNVAASKAKCVLITRFYREDFLQQVSSLEGLKYLLNAGVEIYCLKRLHSKLYVFDDDIAMIGSANFTMGGFRYNHELSLYIEDEPVLIESLSNFFQDLLHRIKLSGDWSLTTDMVDKEIEMANKIIKGRNNKSVSSRNEYQFGADIKEEPAADPIDTIESFLVNKTSSSLSNEVWLKFVGSGNNRFDSGAKYSPDRLTYQGTLLTSFPRRPSGLSNNDYIYLAAVSTDKNGVNTPMIIARARTFGYERKNVATDELIKHFPWMNDYPYYVRLYDLERLDTEIINCISLDTLILELGGNLYPSTFNTGASPAKVRASHHQKSHLKITPVAKEYIDKLFNDLGSKYGIVRD